jgi:hypothetical protein
MIVIRLAGWFHRAWRRLRGKSLAFGGVEFRIRDPDFTKKEVSASVTDFVLSMPTGPNPYFSIGGYVLDARKPKQVFFHTPYGHGRLEWTGEQAGCY